jgi:NAD(P)-dependent dehydrogenase (short-subunit alcohol dehydrogenase family)
MFNNFDGRGAVITGAAHGIGRSLTFALAAEGCEVVLADVDRAGLESTQRSLQAVGISAFPAVTDVADPHQVEKLAEFSFERLGSVTILCNNAGIVGPTADPVWEIDLDEWKRVFEVNVLGVLNGLRSFIPRMERLGTDCHIVNTASECGWLPSAIAPQYFASKHAIVSLTESLRLQAAAKYPWLTTTLLCPKIVDTGITQREKARIETAGLASGSAYAEEDATVAQLVKQSPDLVAQRTIEAMHAGRFYVFPDPASKATLGAEFDQVLAAIERAPSWLSQ